MKTAGLKENAYLVVVSNPVDVLTYLAVQRSGLPWQRVIGLGTQLDTARFRSYLAQQLQVPPTQVQALILGEHGDSMVPIWSSATVAGLPLEQWPGFDAERSASEVFEETKTAGAQVIKLKGGSGFAVGLSIREVVQALALDRRRVLPVSTLHATGRTASATCACRCRRRSAAAACRKQIELPLTPKERLGIAELGAGAARDDRSGRSSDSAGAVQPAAKRPRCRRQRTDARAGRTMGRAAIARSRGRRDRADDSVNAS